MKKLFVLSTIILTACSSGGIKSKPVPKSHNITHICVEDEYQDKLNASLYDLFKQSLVKRKITVDPYHKSCQYVLEYNVRGGDGYIRKAKFVVRDNSKRAIGVVRYYYSAEDNGLNITQQSQKIINELFNQY